ncbi:MAG: hypothetical protein ACYC9J_02190 [Sulfuricaulis sp.]
MGVMQENMLKIHEQIHKIIYAKNPQERERLMQEHRQIMHQHRQAMKDGGMLDGDAKSGAGAGQEQKNSQEHRH